MLDKINRLTIERITFDLRLIIDEYKHNLPVARFQTLKSFLEAIYFLLLQIINEYSHNTNQSITRATLEHFLIAYHSTIPIIVTTTSSVITEEEPIEEFIKNLAEKLLDSSLPVFNDLSTLESVCYRYLYNQVLQVLNPDINDSISMQRVKLLDLFWSKIQSLRHVQINEDNERFIFILYYLMRCISQSDSLI
jgi:GTPase